MTRTAIATTGAPGAIGPYSQAIAMDCLVFCSGQLGLDPATGELAAGVEAQAERSMQNLTAVLAAAPTKGTLSLSANGAFTYVPSVNYVGSDSFTYRASDGATSLGTATVNLTVALPGLAETFDGVTPPALPSGWTTA